MDQGTSFDANQDNHCCWERLADLQFFQTQLKKLTKEEIMECDIVGNTVEDSKCDKQDGKTKSR